MISTIIIITLVFSAFFSGMEIAFLSSNKLQIELEKKQNYRFSNLVSIFINNPKKYISTMLIGNNIALVLYGIMMAKILEPPLKLYIFPETGLLLMQTLISTLIILVFGEFIPKIIFRLNSNFALNTFSIPVSIFYYLFYPLTWVLIKVSNLLIKNISHSNANSNNSIVFGKVDIDNYLNENIANKSSDDEEYELKIFQNALDFSKIKLRECIVPRTEIVALEINEDINNLKEKFIETGYSKILIFKNNIDNIIGYIHTSQLFSKPKQISTILHEILIVPESMPANKLLKLFIQNKRSLAVVVDEFGGTAGMVTIEDIIEEIFGEINDEHDISELEDKKISENEYIFSGRLEIDFINEKYELNIPVNVEYETIAGFILFKLEKIPNLNEIIKIENYSIKIIKATNTKIELIHLKIE